MGRPERVMSLLAKRKGQDRDKPEKAAEEGDLKAVEPLPQQLDERSGDREQKAPDHHQERRTSRDGQRPPTVAGKLHRRGQRNGIVKTTVTNSTPGFCLPMPAFEMWYMPTPRRLKLSKR